MIIIGSKVGGSTSEVGGSTSEVGGCTSEVGGSTSEVPPKGIKKQHCFSLPVFCVDLHKKSCYQRYHLSINLLALEKLTRHNTKAYKENIKKMYHTCTKVHIHTQSGVINQPDKSDITQLIGIHVRCG